VKIETDISDLAVDSFYRDERCKRLEGILRTEKESEEYSAKRYRIQENPDLDPYYILNQQEQCVMELEAKEIDALSDLEMLAYVQVTIETSRRENNTEKFQLIAAGSASVFISFVFIMPIVSSKFLELPFYTPSVYLMLIITIILGGIAYRMSKLHSQKMRELDSATGKQRPLFLQSLRKIVALPDIDSWKRSQYARRIRSIESGLTDANS